MTDAKNDFGFFFEDDNSAILEDVNATKETAMSAARILYAKINGLLVKLESNPEKPTINWPDRTKHVAKFRKELIAVLENAGIDVN